MPRMVNSLLRVHITDLPVHFDLYRVDEASVISVEVPVHFLNQDTCPGIKKGGTLNVVRHTVALDVPAGKIPEELVIDLAGRDIGDVAFLTAFGALEMRGQSVSVRAAG